MLRHRGWNALPGILGVLLAIIGGLVGGVVSDQIPAVWKLDAPTVLAAVVLALVLVSALRSRMLGSGNRRDPWQRSRMRQRAALVLISVYEVLWAIGGLAENMAAANLPQTIKPYAWWLFGPVVVAALFLALLDYLWSSAPPVEETNRKRFLMKLQALYSRRQEDALRGATLIALGLKQEPEFVNEPMLATGTLVGDGQTIADERELPAGTSIVEAYDAAHGHLLILGAPGAGKTTLLVELGLKLWQRARDDGKQPMPVICNLSTWAINRLPLDQWLAEDLVRSYQVPQSQAKAWVASEAVLPLLDGLDEVAVDHRATCVRSINAFHDAHPNLPLAVCCRIEDYRTQGAPVTLRDAVMVEPLTDVEIDAYLAYGGERLATLRAVVAASTALREVVRTPLLLRVVVLTYEAPQEGGPGPVIPPVGDHDAWVRQLFGEYVERMLKRRRRLEIVDANSPEDVEQPTHQPKEVERYLAWLAWQMRAHGLVELYLEQIQPTWLPNTRARKRYQAIIGLVVGVSFGLLWGSTSALIVGLGFGLSLGLVVALVGGLAFGLGNTEIKPRAAIQWSWADALIGGLIIGLLSGLAAGFLFGLFGGQAHSLVFGLFGLLTGLPIGVLVRGFDSKSVNEHNYRFPSEGIHRSARNAIIAVLTGGLLGTLAIALIFGLLAGLFFGPVRELARGLAGGLAVGLMGGLFAGEKLGGDAVLQHVALRWILRHERLLPPHLVRFLDYAADHVLLQRVGGGYRFTHGLLQDYFANLNPQNSETTAMQQ